MGTLLFLQFGDNYKIISQRIEIIFKIQMEKIQMKLPLKSCWSVQAPELEVLCLLGVVGQAALTACREPETGRRPIKL